MKPNGHKGDLLRFGAFELDLASRELRKGGALVKIQSQQVDLLALLARQPGEVVSRDEIRRALWDEETFVDFDQSINFCVNKIRNALNDDPQRPRYIETLPRKGYRFIATAVESGTIESGIIESTNGFARTSPVASPPAVAQPARPGRRWLLIAAASAALVVTAVTIVNVVSRQPAAKPIESLAVLPLENLSHDPEQDYFADGMTDELITDLAKISALRVISRTSVTQYKGTRKSIPQIARELNVDAVLEGAVTRDRGRVRITAQLIAAAPEKHLWAEQYEGSLSNVVTLQDAVAKAVAREIQIKVTPREQALLAAPRAVDPAAHEAYLKGHYLWVRSGEGNLKKSREYFERAIAQDPGYALAWAGLADAYGRLAAWGVLPFQDALPRARAAAEKALELDHSLTQPLVRIADVKANYEWDWAGAERLYKQAIELNPNDGDAHHGYATYLAAVGRNSEAVAEARRASEVEPLFNVYSANIIWKLYLARQYDQAQVEIDKLVGLDPRVRGGYISASVYLGTGHQRDAIAVLQKGAEDSHRAALDLMYLGHALGVTGARAEGQKVLGEMLALSHRRYVPPEYIALVYEGLAERDLALQWFNKAYTEHSMNIWILPDPRLDEIRTDPRFKHLMRGMGLLR